MSSTRQYSFGKWALMVALILAAVVSLFPIVWMATSSVKTEDEIYKDPPTWIPENFTLEHYSSLFSRFHFGQLTINSVVISASVVVVSTILGSMAAYGFSRYGFRGSGILLGFILLARMITPAALVVPLYIVMKVLSLLNTLTSIMIGITVLNLPFVVWIMKPFFDGLPKEIEEAAEIDGLSPIRVFWRIAMPVAAPGIYTVILFSFITGWVDFLFGISFSTATQSMPLTVGLAQMQTGYEIYWGPMMAGGIYLTLPTFLLAFALQKYLIRGVRLGF